MALTSLLFCRHCVDFNEFNQIDDNDKKERIEIYFNGLYLSTSHIVFTIRDFAGTEDSLRRESDWGINWDGVRNRVF